uniref:PLC-beta PH domain-containing protein n=1 Tax=Plectus sambesii TaxID=2011161 RepID=A0A914WDF4_9BILA
MSPVKTGVHTVSLRKPDVAEFLRNGERFYKVEESAEQSDSSFVTLRLDPKGHVIYWSNLIQSLKGHLDISIVLDVRHGKYAKLPKNSERLKKMLAGTFVTPASAFTDSFLTIVHGCDFAAPSYTTFIANSPTTAEKWSEMMFKIATNLLSLNGSAMHFIERAHANLLYARSYYLRYGALQGEYLLTNEIVKMIVPSEKNTEERKMVEAAIKSAEFCEKAK